MGHIIDFDLFRTVVCSCVRAKLRVVCVLLEEESTNEDLTTLNS